MKKTTPLLFLVGISAFAQTNVALTGKLIDTQGNPIPDIEIELSSLGLRDTTDGTGQWSINANTPIRNNGTALPLDAQFSGNDLYLSLAQSAKVQIEISDIAGQRTSILGEQALAAGKHQIELRHKLPYGTYFLRVWAGQLSRTFRIQYSSLDNQIHASEQGAATITDKLVYRFQGQFLTEDQISKYEQYIEKFLQIRNISGQFTTGQTTVKKVSAWLSGSSMALPINVRLGWIPQTHSYSGKAYSVKPLGSDVFNYQVFTFGVDSLDHRSTQSDTLSFDSFLGDVSIPTTVTGNVLPVIVDSIPDTLSVGDSVHLNWKVTDKFGSIKLRRFRIDGGSWTTIDSTGTTLFTSQTPKQLIWEFEAMDNDSNFSRQNGTIEIIQDLPVIGITGPSPIDLVSNLFNKGTPFYASTAQRFGKIVKYEWSLDGVNYTTGDSVFKNNWTFTQKTEQRYHIYLRVTDDDGGISTVQRTINYITGDRDSALNMELPIQVVKLHDRTPFRTMLANFNNVQYVDWDFGHRSPTNPQTVRTTAKDSSNTDHLWDSLGTFMVTQTITDINNTKTVKTVKVIVQDYFNDTRFKGTARYTFATYGKNTWMTSDLFTGDGYTYWSKNSTSTRYFPYHSAMTLSSNCDLSDCSSQIKSVHQGICPVGWHIPARQEFDSLNTYISKTFTPKGYTIPTHSSANYTDWDRSAMAAANNTGFSIRPTGFYNSGTLELQDTLAAFWVKEVSDATIGNNFRLDVSDPTSLAIGDRNKSNGLAVRCVKD